MWDIIYLGITVAFFALMLLYVRACRALAAADPEKDVGGTR